MGLYNSAWLVIDEDPRLDDPRTAAFEFRNIKESQSTQEPQYVMGGRGLFINQAEALWGSDEEVSVDQADSLKRSGYWLDGLGGSWSATISFKVSASSVETVWGDQRSNPGQSNVTRSDATGKDIEARTRQQVLDYWLAQTRSDSFANTRLHIGEWTNGEYPDYQDNEKVSASAGVYGSPFPVAVESTQFSVPEDESGTVDGTITFQRVKTFPFTENQLSDWVGRVNIGAGGPVSPYPPS